MPNTLKLFIETDQDYLALYAYRVALQEMIDAAAYDPLDSADVVALAKRALEMFPMEVDTLMTYHLASHDVLEAIADGETSTSAEELKAMAMAHLRTYPAEWPRRKRAPRRTAPGASISRP